MTVSISDPIIVGSIANRCRSLMLETIVLSLRVFTSFANFLLGVLLVRNCPAYCLLLTAYCLLLSVCYLLFTAYFLPSTVYCILFTAYFLLFTVWRLLLTATEYCLLFTVCCLLLTFYWVLFTADCLLLTFTVYCLLLGWLSKVNCLLLTVSYSLSPGFFSLCTVYFLLLSQVDILIAFSLRLGLLIKTYCLVFFTACCLLFTAFC